MIFDAIAVAKTAATAYRTITPFSQLMIRGFSATIMGLVCIITPDILVALGAPIAEWKHGTFFVFGWILLGTGLAFGFIPQIFPIHSAYKLIQELECANKSKTLPQKAEDKTNQTKKDPE